MSNAAAAMGAESRRRIEEKLGALEKRCQDLEDRLADLERRLEKDHSRVGPPMTIPLLRSDGAEVDVPVGVLRSVVPIHHPSFTAGMRRALEKYGDSPRSRAIETIGDLVRILEADLLAIRTIGRKTVRDFNEFLGVYSEECGVIPALTLGMRPVRPKETHW